MVLTAQERSGLVRRLVRRWQKLISGLEGVAAIDDCGSAERARIARDLGVGEAEFRVLAGKWPDAADLLSRRMKEIKLEGPAAAAVEAQVLRDLQRVCTLCASKRRCQNDLARNPADPSWQSYCPNRTTLIALTAGRGSNAP